MADGSKEEILGKEGLTTGLALQSLQAALARPGASFVQARAGRR